MRRQTILTILFLKSTASGGDDHLLICRSAADEQTLRSPGLEVTAPAAAPIIFEQ
jgi:hypothetical protein